MDQRATECCSAIRTNESLTEFGSFNGRKGIHPSIFLSKTNREKAERRFCPELEAKARAFQWALNRLSGWCLPGKEHVEDYLRDMYRRGLRPKTYSSNLTAIYFFLTLMRGCGKTRLEEITKEDLEAFIEQEQDRGLRISTVRTRLHCVNAFLGYLIEAGVIRGDVLTRRIRLRKPESLPRAIDPDDVERLFSVIHTPRDRAMVMVLLRTGMRIGELLSTRMQDLHLKDRKVDIYEGEKSRIGRVVYLSEDAMKALKVWIKVRESHKVFLFYATGKHTMSYTSAYMMFKGYLRKAGLTHKGYGLHALRHTFASELLNAGMRLEYLQPLMGHTSVEVTRRYARLTDKAREKEYFRAMTIIERGEVHGSYRLDPQVQAFLEEKERLPEYR